MIVAAAMEGLGIGCLSRRIAEPLIATGRLKQVLANYEMVSDTAICALYPGSTHMLPRLRVFLDFMAEAFRKARTGEASPCCGTAAAVESGIRVIPGLVARN